MNLVCKLNIWLPDLFITNTADNNGFIQVTDSNLAFIENDGYVRLTLSLIGIWILFLILIMFYKHFYDKGLRTRCLIEIKKVY